MKRLGRILLIVAIALPIVVIGGSIAVWYGVGGTDPVSRAVLGWISAREGSRWVVQSTRVKGDLLHRVELDSVRVAWRDRAGAENDLLRADQMVIAWRPRAVFQNRLEIQSVELHHATIWLSRLPALREGGAGAASPGGRAGGGGIPLHPLLASLLLDASDVILREEGTPVSLRGVHGMITGDITGTDWRLAVSSGDLHTGDRALALAACSVHAVVGKNAVSLPDFEVGAGESVLRGRAELVVEPFGVREADLSFVPLSLPDLATIYGGSVPHVPGAVKATVSLTGDGAVTRLAGAISGQAGNTRFDLPRVFLRVEGKAITVDSLAGEVAGADVTASGAVELAGAREHHGIIAFSHLPLAAFLRAGGEPVAGQVGGTIDWSGRGFSAGERELLAHLRLSGGTVSTIRIPAAEVTAALHPDGAIEADLVSRRSGDHLEAHLAQHAGGALTGEVTLTVSAASRPGLLAELSGLERMSGAGRLHGTISGTRLRPVISVSGRFDSLATGDFAADSVGFGGTWDASGAGSPLIVSLEARGISQGTRPLADASLRLEGGLDHAGLTRLEFRGRDFRAEGAGAIDRTDAETVITLSTLQLTTRGLDWSLAAPAHFVVSGGETRLDGIRLTSGDAEAAVSGRVRGSEIAADAHLHGLELKRLGDVAVLGGPAAGLVTIDGSITGTIANPAAQATARLANGVIRGLPVLSALVDLALEDGRLTVRKGHLEGSGGSFDLAGWIPVRAPAAAADSSAAGVLLLTTHDLRLSAFRPMSKYLAQAEGRIDLEARWVNPRGRRDITFTTAIRGLALGDHEVGDVTANGRFAGNVIDLADAVVTGGVNGGTVHLTGRVPLAGAAVAPEGFRFTADVDRGDLAILTLLTHYVSEARGAFSGHLEMTGTPERRVMNGTLVVSDGTIVIPNLGHDVIREVNGSATIVNNVFTIGSLTGRQGDAGRVNATGTAELTGNLFGIYDLRVTTRRYEPHLWGRGITGLLNCDFTVRPDTLAGGRVVPHLAGEVNAEELLVKRELPPAAPEGEPALALPPPAVTFELRCWAHRDVRLQTSVARLELQGEVYASLDESGLRLLGELTTTRGYYLLYGTRRFEVTRGNFTFSDIQDIGNVGLDVLAETNVRGERINVTMTGTLRKPVIETTSASGLDETAIFRMLTLGAPGAEQGTQGGYTSGLVEAWRGAILERLGARVAQDIGVDEIRLRSEGTNGTGPRLEVGKRWADLYLSFKTALTGQEPGATTPTAPPSWELRDPERSLSVEYRMSDRFSVAGEAGTLQGTDYVNVDLKYRLEY